MSTMSRVLGAGAVGTSVYSITNEGEDAAAAAGYAAWVESITGSLPDVRDLGGGRAGVYLSESQAMAMRAWLEGKLQRSIVGTAAPSTLDIEFSPVVKPIMLKYLLVFGTLIFLSGWTARGFIR